MLLAGDEFARTPQGNNNAYCQVDEISWMDWTAAESERGRMLVRYVRRLTALRQEYAVLRRTRFLTGERNEALDVKDVAWINANGAEMTDADWNDGNMRAFGMLIDGRAQATGIRRRGSEATMLLVMNAWHDLVRFTLPSCEGGDAWTLLVDTNAPDADRRRLESGQIYDVTGRSLLLFVLTPAA
jgi:glycogen operon protein